MLSTMSKQLPDLEDYEISVSNLQSILSEQPDSIRVIDCREEEEFQICRIEGATLVSLSRFAELAPALLGDEDRPLVIY